MEAEREGMCLQVKEHQELLTPTKSQEKGVEHIPP